MKEELIILSTDGPYCNIIKMKPPMCFNMENVDHFCEKLTMVLKELQNKNINLNAVSQVDKTKEVKTDRDSGVELSIHNFVNGQPVYESVIHGDNDIVTYAKPLST